MLVPASGCAHYDNLISNEKKCNVTVLNGDIGPMSHSRKEGPIAQFLVLPHIMGVSHLTELSSTDQTRHGLHTTTLLHKVNAEGSKITTIGL